VLAQHVQLVLSDRSRLTDGQDLGVVSPKTWRLSDLGAKHAFLLAGRGWGGMPLHLVEADLASGVLVFLTPEDSDARIHMAMSATYRTDAPPGPAGTRRQLVDLATEGYACRRRFCLPCGGRGAAPGGWLSEGATGRRSSSMGGRLQRSGRTRHGAASGGSGP